MVRVLLVDDEPANTSLLERFINRTCKASISLASSAEEAIHTIEKEERFDLVVCDYHMPGGEGTKVYDTVSSMEKRPYFLLWTQTHPDELPVVDGPGFLGTVAKSDFRRVCSLVTALDLRD